MQGVRRISRLGREVAPRLVDILVAALERRLTQPTKSSSITFGVTSNSLYQKSRGACRQTRYRGGWKS